MLITRFLLHLTLDHCIDYLRQVIMCESDVTPVPTGSSLTTLPILTLIPCTSVEILLNCWNGWKSTTMEACQDRHQIPVGSLRQGLQRRYWITNTISQYRRMDLQSLERINGVMIELGNHGAAIKVVGLSRVSFIAPLHIIRNLSASSMASY